jgi:hypothetical protein
MFYSLPLYLFTFIVTFNAGHDPPNNFMTYVQILI